jgi:hypothetical protein
VGGGLKNEAMEKTVDAAWLQAELNRHEKIVTSDTEEQTKGSRKKKLMKTQMKADLGA